MHHFRRKPSNPPPVTPKNNLPSTSTSPIEYINKEIVRRYSRAKDPKALAASSSAIALSIASPSRDVSDAVPDEPESSKEPSWRTAYGAARMAVEIAKESSDMFLPLKAVVGALAVLIKNYDQTTANTEQIRGIEERVQSLAEVLASPVGDQDSGEKARREALRKKLAGVIARLGPLSEQRGLLRFLKNVDHANTLNGFVQELAYAITDYQISIQQSIHETAKRIDEKIGGSTKKIYENTQNIIAASDLELLEKLDPVHNAGHQAGHHDTCLRGTRQSTLDGIMRWARDPQDRHVFWLNGLAGTGKSTIAQTFAEMVASNGALGASFFCSRDYLDRKELKNIFPTLAYQLASRYPAFRSQIIHVIKQDPSIARNSLMSQLKDLIADPLSFTGISCVIVVDALDECVDDQPASAILSVLGRFAKHLPSVKFFITGRPEPRIRAGFRLPLLEPFTQVFLLHKVKISSVDKDIQLYLREKLTAVAKRRSDFDLADPWPRDEDLTSLTKKSSGLFIFASTLVRFIESEHHEPNERLQLVVTLPDSTVHEGRAGIDPLYTQVLMRGFGSVEEVAVFENLRRVLGAVILAFNPLSRAQVAKILNIEPSRITATLRHLHSVLLIPNEDSKEIRVFHKSFPDFLQDSDRCSDPKFFIASPAHHGKMARGCLKLLNRLRRNPCDLPDFVMNRDVPNISELLEDRVGSASRYACAYWAMHIRSSPTNKRGTIELISSAIEFFKGGALPWIEVMSLENRLEGVIHNINNLIDWLGTVDVFTYGLDSQARDCLRFTMHFFPLIQQSAPHIYHSALPLSPRSSMFCSMSLPDKTRIVEFHGRSDNWGSVLRTIKGAPGGFTCMTAIGRGSTARIAAARDDGTVGIYDSVTGVLRLSLSPPHSVQAMTGSPDGFILFCTHQGIPSEITMWDIQTGGLVHTFTLTTEATDTAVSLNGRYLACGLSDGTVNVWEVANRTGGPVFGNGEPIACLCWLAPEGWFMVANGALLHIRDIANGIVSTRSFEMRDPVRGAAYFQKPDPGGLAVVTGSGTNNSLTIINIQTRKLGTSYRFRQQFSRFAFSQTTEVLMYGPETRGLVLTDVFSKRETKLDLPATITSVSKLSNGTMVANAAGIGIQLLSPDDGFTPAPQLIPPTLNVYPLDKGRITAIVPTSHDRIILLETAIMSEVLVIPAWQKHLSVHIDRTVILCASLKKKIAVHCLAKRGQEYLQLRKFDDQYPRWTTQVNKPPSAGDISPAYAWLVTFHYARSQSDVCIWDMHSGSLVARLDIGRSRPPLNITFGSGDTFRVYHDTHRTTYSVATSLQSGTPTHSIVCGKQRRSVGQAQKQRYFVDDSHEWVVSGSQRICWIPPGYIGPDRASHCWAGSSLVMAGQDGTLRKLVFRESL